MNSMAYVKSAYPDAEIWGWRYYGEGACSGLVWVQDGMGRRLSGEWLSPVNAWRDAAELIGLARAVCGRAATA